MEMMIVVRTKTDALFKAVAAALNSLVVLDAENIDIEITSFVPKKERVSRKGVPLGARKFYVAVDLPEDPIKRAETIEKNLAVLGQGTILARVYTKIVNATLEGTQITEGEIRKEFFTSAGASQRVMGDLGKRVYKLIESRPIPVEG